MHIVKIHCSTLNITLEKFRDSKGEILPSNSFIFMVRLDEFAGVEISGLRIESALFLLLRSTEGTVA